MASSWNAAVNVLKSLCKGNDWSLFLKVFTVLYRFLITSLTLLSSKFIFGFVHYFLSSETVVRLHASSEQGLHVQNAKILN